MIYDEQNVFAKILRGDLPCTKVHETDHSLAFLDIAPQAKIHVLVIPKRAYVSWDDFSANATGEEQADYVAAIGATARNLESYIRLSYIAVMAQFSPRSASPARHSGGPAAGADARRW